MNRSEHILVSACLLGTPCRYDAASIPCEAVMALQNRATLVPVCPEVLGGLPTPRTPSERKSDGHVVDELGEDRTAAFVRGAEEAVLIAREHGCTCAVLKSRSPSCGVHSIYDGTFTRSLVEGEGVAAEALRCAGLVVFDDEDIAHMHLETGFDPVEPKTPRRDQLS